MPYSIVFKMEQVGENLRGGNKKHTPESLRRLKKRLEREWPDHTFKIRGDSLYLYA